MTSAEFFATRHAQLEAGTLNLLAGQGQQTATQLRSQLRAGMRELDRVLQSMRVRGLIRSRRKKWELVP